MCLVIVAWHVHPDFPLIVAANRDEFHSRPTAEAQWWADGSDVLGGRDLRAQGGWLAISRTGRFATVTNYREQSFTKADRRSRGQIVVDFVAGHKGPLQFADNLDGDEYAGFNLFCSDGESLAYTSNRGDDAKALPPGIYGLSNASLDTPWQKLLRCKSALQQCVDNDDVGEEQLLALLSDRRTTDEDVHAEHLSAQQATAITAPFIVTESYGTRCSTVILQRPSGRTRFVERRFDENGAGIGQSEFDYRVLSGD